MKHLLFIVLLTAILITTGCVGENKNIVVTSTQTTAASNIVSVNPIVGMWQFTNVNGQVCTNTFLNDGKYTLTCTGNDVTVKGNWIEIRTNEYQVSYESVKDVNNYIYQPGTDTILNTVSNAILYRPGKMPSYESSSGASSDSASSIQIRVISTKDNIVVADVTNIGRTDLQKIIVIVNSYDGEVKLGTHTGTIYGLKSGETGRVKIYLDSDATKYKFDSVGVSIGGDEIYKVYFEVVTPTATATPTPTQSIVPPQGIWVRVSYPGSYVGLIGTPGNQLEVSGTGDKNYQISINDGIVAAAVQKKDDSSDKIVLEVYKNGFLLKRDSSVTPKGIVEIQLDLKGM